MLVSIGSLGAAALIYFIFAYLQKDSQVVKNSPQI